MGCCTSAPNIDADKVDTHEELNQVTSSSSENNKDQTTTTTTTNTSKATNTTTPKTTTATTTTTTTTATANTNNNNTNTNTNDNSQELDKMSAKRLEELQESNEKLRAELLHMQRKMEEAAEQTHIVKQQQEEIKVLKTQLQIAREELTAVVNDSKDEKENKPNHERRQSAAHILKMSSEMDKLQEQLTQKEQAIAALSKTKEELENRLTYSEAELELAKNDAHNKLAQLQAANATLQNQHNETKQQLDTLRHKHAADILQKETEIIELRTQVHSREEPRLSISAKGDQLSLENAKLKQRLSTLRSQQTSFQEIRQEYMDEVKKLKERDPQFLQQIFDEREDLKKQLNTLRSTFKSKSYELELKLEDATREKENLTKKFQDFEQNAVKHEKEMTALQLKLDNINKEKQAVEKQVTDLTLEMQNLKNNSTAGASTGEDRATGNANTQKLLKGLFAKNTDDSKSTENKTPGQSETPQLTLAQKIAKAKEEKEKAEKAANAEPGAAQGQSTSAQGQSTSAQGQADPRSALLAGLLKKNEKNNTPAQEAAAAVSGSLAGPVTSLSEAADRYAKYEKMKKLGMPPQSIKNKMKMDAFTDEDIAKFFGESVPEKPKTETVDLSKHDLSKYEKMKKFNMPEGAIRNKMKQDKIDERVIAAFFGDPIPEPKEKAPEEEEEEMKPPGEKPDLEKYERMKKINMPPPAIRNKMKQDQIHEYWVCVVLGEPIPKVKKGAAPPTPQPDLTKYEKMKKVGMPDGAIRNKMKQDQIHAYWIAFFFGEPLPGAAAKAKVVKKARNVKPFHWRKKSDCEWEKTIWKEVKVDDSFLAKDFQNLIETQFRNEAEKKKSADDKKKQEKKEPEVISLVDGKRSFNITVGMSRVNLTDIEIRDCLLNMDEMKIDREMIQKLLKYVPTNDELNTIRSFKGDKSKLGRAEKFFDVLSVMTDIPLRLELWEFKMSFYEKVSDIEVRITTVDAALTLLRESPHIRKFMEVCLAVGNFINEGTNRGDAKGFRLETFDRLESLRTSDGKMTMFMFMVQFIDNNHKELFAEFPDNLSKTIEEAKKMESKAIRDSIGDMEDALERIGKRIRRANRNLKDLQKQFNKRAGTVLSIFSKLKEKSSQVKMESRANVLKGAGAGAGGGGILAKVKAKQAAAGAARDRSGTLQVTSPKEGEGTTTDEESEEGSGVQRARSSTLKKTPADGKEPAANGAPPSDRFESAMTSFHTRAESKVSQLKESFTRLKEKAGETAEFFGEHDDLEWEQMFKMFLKFFEQYSKSHKALQELKKKEEKERLQKEKEEKKKLLGDKKKTKNELKVGPGEKQPTNILEEIRLKSARGVLMPEKSEPSASSPKEPEPGEKKETENEKEKTEKSETTEAAEKKEIVEKKETADDTKKADNEEEDELAADELAED